MSENQVDDILDAENEDLPDVDLTGLDKNPDDDLPQVLPEKSKPNSAPEPEYEPDEDDARYVARQRKQGRSETPDDDDAGEEDRDDEVSSFKAELDALRREQAEARKAALESSKETIGNRIDRLSSQYDSLKSARAEAIREGDGNAVNRLDDEIRKVESAYAANVQRIGEIDEQLKNSGQPKRQESGPDPVVRRRYESWVERNLWFDPNGSDRRSAKAIKVSKELTAAGFDPSSKLYWQKLDYRLNQTAAPTRSANARVPVSGASAMTDARPPVGNSSAPNRVPPADTQRIYEICLTTGILKPDDPKEVKARQIASLYKGEQEAARGRR